MFQTTNQLVIFCAVFFGEELAVLVQTWRKKCWRCWPNSAPSLGKLEDLMDELKPTSDIFETSNITIMIMDIL